MKKMKLLGFLGLVAALGGPVAQAQMPPYFGAMGVEQAWRTTRGAGVLIASLNTGVNYHLPEFAGRVVKGADGGFGYDAILDQADGMDQNEFGLGTKVASVALGNTFGVAPEARLLPIRIFGENGTADVLSMIRGLRYAQAQGARIIEFGGASYGKMDATLCAALREASERGALLVMPAGNSAENLDIHSAGCDLPAAVRVAGTNLDGVLSDFSNFGFGSVHLAAGAENVWSVGRDGSPDGAGHGTSFSTALASGVAALVWAAHPEYTAADVKAALIRGSTPKDSLRGKVMSNGWLNAFGAVLARTDLQ